MKRLSIAGLIALSISTQAHADSFCGYDKGLIGTKAIGYISPFHINSYAGETETPGCELRVYDEIPSSEQTPEVRPCTDFTHMPSFYVSQSIEQGFDPMRSDYYALLAFAAEDKWAQIALKNGDMKWVENVRDSSFSFPYQYTEADASVRLENNHPSQSMVFEAPRLDEPDRHFGSYFRKIDPSWFDGEAQYKLFEHPLFDFLETHGMFDRKHIEQQSLNAYEDLFQISYEVTKIIRDEEGREWLEASEHLSVPTLHLPDYVETELARKKKDISREEMLKLHQMTGERIRSDAIRTVYFPYREPGGTIVMVMEDGPGCD